MNSLQLLSWGDAELVGECSQDAWRTKAWRGLAEFFMLGSHLQATAVKFFPPEKVLPPDPGTSSSKLSQGGAELVGECGQDDWRTKAWRGLGKFFMLGSYLQATAFGIFHQEKVLPSGSGPSPSKLSQDAWRIKIWRGLAEFYTLGSQLQATNVELVPPEAAPSSS